MQNDYKERQNLMAVEGDKTCLRLVSYDCLRLVSS